MIGNDILRSVRYTLDLSDKQLLNLIGEGQQCVSAEQLKCYLAREDEADFDPCPDVVVAAFLNGLISARRGKRDPQPSPETAIDNNLVLKKLRIAFELRDNDIHSMIHKVGSRLSRSELNAVFQKREHKNFKRCGDQLLVKFSIVHTQLTQNLQEAVLLDKCRDGFLSDHMIDLICRFNHLTID